MPRQRLRSRTSPIAHVGRAILVIFSLALVWYGLMLVLLALEASPGSLDAVSGYRTVYDYLAGLTPEDVDGLTRLIAALAGVAAFLAFGYLALKEIPRPYLARSDVRLTEDERGTVDVQPRAIERVAEAAAAEHPAVSSATGRYGTDDLDVSLDLQRARDLKETLIDVQDRVVNALHVHGLPEMPVNVTLTGFDRKQRRELS